MNRFWLTIAIVWALGSLVIAADAPKAPKVGTQAVKKEDYKPVVGKPGGRLVYAALGEPKTFNPITAGETSTTVFTARIFEGLIELDPFTADVTPRLAEKWDVAPDGVTWTFHLRKDVVFNDGTPFTSKDVVFTWNDLIYDMSRPAGKDPRWPCSMRDIATFEGKPVKVEAVDEYTVKFTTPVKVAVFDQLAGASILSEKKYGALVKDGSFGGALSIDSKPEDLVGTNAFMLGEYVRGEKVVLKKNPNYRKKDEKGQRLPYLDEVSFLIAREMNTVLLMFQQQKIDYFALRSGKDVAELKPKQDEGNFTLYQLGPDYGTLFATFNMNLDAAKAGKIPEYKVKWFRDLRFRQAVSYAIDRGALVRNVLRGLGYPLAAPFTMGVGPFQQEGYVPYTYDLAKAKALLAEMGMKEKDGVLKDADGNEVAFTINTNAGNDVREEAATFIRTDLSKLGMKINFLPLQFNLLVTKMDSSQDWECIVMGLTGGLEPHDGANVWKSSGRLHMWWPNQKSPGSDWEKRVDEIFETGIQEMDKGKRKQIYRDWVDIAYKQQPFIYLTTTERVVALRRKFGNVFPSSTPAGLLHNEDEIFILDSAQK